MLFARQCGVSIYSVMGLENKGRKPERLMENLICNRQAKNERTTRFGKALKRMKNAV